MSSTYSTGLTSVTGNVAVTVNNALPQPAATQNVIVKQAYSNAATKVTLHTVTAGKTFYAQYIIYNNQNTTTVRSPQLYADDNTTVILDAGTLPSTTRAYPLGCKPYAQNTTVQFSSNGGSSTDISATIVGYEA